jgi:RNA polymerase sigma-70 factor (ECF subfamily)
VIRRAAAGDRAAREELFRRFGGRLSQIARRMLRCSPRLRQREETDDVMQQAALRLHRSLQDARPQHVRELFGLAVVQIQRVLIDLARHHFGPLGAAAHELSLPAERSPNAAAPVLAPETLEAWAAFHEQIASLPFDEREAFGVIWYGGATQKEAAELLGVAERTILRRVHKARLRLATELSAHADELRRGRNA